MYVYYNRICQFLKHFNTAGHNIVFEQQKSYPPTSTHKKEKFMSKKSTKLTALSHNRKDSRSLSVMWKLLLENTHHISAPYSRATCPL